MIDDEITSPNSHWEASEELSAFLGTINRQANEQIWSYDFSFSYPRLDVDEVYTPAMDDFLKPFIIIYYGSW